MAEEESIQFNTEDTATKLIICVVAHPFNYAKTLIQIGYEPLPSFPTWTIFGTPRIGLPGVFSYLGFIFRQEGVTGLFRGLPYNIAHHFIYKYSYKYIGDNLEKCCPYLDLQLPVSKSSTSKEFQPASNITIKLSNETSETLTPADFKTNLNELIKTITRDGLCITGALTVSYPVQVILVRNFASFVGKETIYEFPLSAVKDIIKNEGFFGFYSGFVPKLIGELSCLLLTKSIIILLIKPYVKQPEYSSPLSSIVSFMIPALLYPFNLVSSIMAVNGCKSLEAANLEPEFIDWVDCWNHLSVMGNIKRGSSIIWRYQTQPRFGSPPKPDRYSAFDLQTKRWS